MGYVSRGEVELEAERVQEAETWLGTETGLPVINTSNKCAHLNEVSLLPWILGGSQAFPAGLRLVCVFMAIFCLFLKPGVCQTLNKCRQSWQGGVTAQETETQS